MLKKLTGVNCWNDGVFAARDISIDVSSCDEGAPVPAAGNCYPFLQRVTVSFFPVS